MHAIWLGIAPSVFIPNIGAGEARAVGRRLSAAGRARLKAGISSR